MSDISSGEAVAALLFIVVILQFRRLSTFFNLAKYSVRPSVWAELPREEVPAHTLSLLDCAATELKGIGFEPVCVQAAAPFNAIDPRRRVFAEVHWHPEKSVLARVSLAEAITGQVTKVQFQSLFADGGSLITVNRERWATFPVPKEIQLEDAYAEDLAGQWQAHQNALAGQAQRETVTDRDDALRREAALGLPHWLEHLRQLGWIREESTGNYCFTARGAWRFAGQMAGTAAKDLQALARPFRHDPSPDLESARLAEMDSIAAALALGAKPLPSWLKTGLFALTLALALSAVLFGWGFGPLEAAALLTVLVVHEFGHLAAMWLFDYRNLSIFFLPFLGAAATGHKPHAPPWQEAIVLFAGPLPGLILALAALQIPSDALPAPMLEFIRVWIWFSVFLNLFNLLPVGMLDGGRLFELAVLGRFPRARAVFVALGVACGIAYAVSTGSIVMGVLMLLLLSGVPLQFKAASVIARIRAKAGKKPLDGEQTLHALGLEFTGRDYGDGGSKGFMRRMNIAKLAYPMLMQGVPGLAVSLGVLASLMICWVAPFIVLVWSWQHESMPLLRQTEAERQEIARQQETRPAKLKGKRIREEFQARYQAESDPVAKWAMLDRQEQEGPEAFLDDGYLDWDMQQRELLIGLLPADHAGRLRHELNQAAVGKEGTVETLLSIIARLGGDKAGQAANLDEERLDLLLDACRRLAQEAPPDRLGAAQAALDGLWAATAPPGHPLAGQRATLAQIRAHIAFSGGQFGEAETWMERYRAEAGAKNKQAALAQGWFLLDIGRPDQALALAAQNLGPHSQQDYALRQWQTLAGWAEMGLGHPREADAHFQAVLDTQSSRLAAGRDREPWWLRLLGQASSMFWERQWIGAPTLDHLAALEGYDHAAAARLSADLRKRVARRDGRPPAINSGFDGWGKAREEAHAKLLQALQESSTN